MNYLNIYLHLIELLQLTLIHYLLKLFNVPFIASIVLVLAYYLIIFCCRYPYLTVVLNFSQMWALYCLVKFYNVTHDHLKSIRPLAKFISFKAIVFATWWQGVGIALLSSLGVLHNGGELESGLQDFLICIEVSCYLVYVFAINFFFLIFEPMSIERLNSMAISLS